MPSGGARPGAGRRPKRPALKLVTGTKFKEGKNAAAAKEPEIPAGPVIAPADLTDDELRYFSQVVNMLVAEKRSSPNHVQHIAMLARRLAEIEMLAAVISIEGITAKSTSTRGSGKNAVVTEIIRARPEVAMRSEAMRHAQSLLNDLMLSPAAALKIGNAGAGEANPFDDF